MMWPILVQHWSRSCCIFLLTALSVALYSIPRDTKGQENPDATGWGTQGAENSVWTRHPVVLKVLCKAPYFESLGTQRAHSAPAVQSFVRRQMLKS